MRSLVRTPDVHIGNSDQVIARIKTDLWRLKCKSVLIVSDPGVVASGAVRLIQKPIEDASVCASLFSDVKPTPTVENVRAGVKELRRSQARAVVAIGGGSVIDAAKMIGIAYANTQFAHITNLEGTPSTRVALPFLIAVPTTFSPAASSASFVAYDRADQRQFRGFDEHALPQTVCVNTEFLATMPDVLAAQTACETLVALLDAHIACVRQDGVDNGCSSAQAESSDSAFGRAMRVLIEQSMHDFAAMSSRGRRETWSAEEMCEISIIAGSMCDQIVAQSGGEHHTYGILQAVARALSARYAMPYGCACERVVRHIEDVFSGKRAEDDHASLASIGNVVANLPAQHFPFVVSEGDVDALVRHVVLDLSIGDDDEKTIPWLRFACSLLIKEH